MSKFASVLKAVKDPQDLPVSEPSSDVVKVSRGRPKGKRSDPAFEQVTAYIQKETYLQTKIALLQAGNDKDFSQLVEELLCAYLRTQKSSLSATRPVDQHSSQ